MGSQPSSGAYFESDSMSQLEDMECFAMHTVGGHFTTMTPPAKSHDNSSQLPYSRDINLQLHSHPVVLSQLNSTSYVPLPVDETLEDRRPTLLERKKASICLKSSEWIRHQLERSKETIVQVCPYIHTLGEPEQAPH